MSYSIPPPLKKKQKKQKKQVVFQLYSQRLYKSMADQNSSNKTNERLVYWHQLTYLILTLHNHIEFKSS